MATMETTFTLYDRASAPLREINRTISAVMENYENLQAKMEYSIDPSGIRKMNMELSKTGKEFSLSEKISGSPRRKCRKADSVPENWRAV